MPIRGWLLACAIASMVLASLTSSTQLSPASPALLIRNATILSMDEEAPRRGSVLVRGDRIGFVGPTAALPRAPGAHIVEGSGRFLIPGLIDMHTMSRRRADRRRRCWSPTASPRFAISAAIMRGYSPGAARSGAGTRIGP